MDERAPGSTVSPGNQSGPAEPTTQWQFKLDDTEINNSSAPARAPTINKNNETLTWSASEFVAHKKTIGWYLLLSLAAIIAAAAVFFWTKDKISTGAVIVAAVFLGIFGARQPRTLAYELKSDGINVGGKFYEFDSFKSFSIIEEGVFSSILFMPLKRFKSSLSVYYDPKDESKITNILATKLPFEDRKLDPIDKFMGKIRF